MIVRHPVDGRVHFSELKEHRHSPAHALHAFRSASDELTRAMTVGAVGDDLVFHGGKHLAVYSGKVRNGREWDAFKDGTEGLIRCIVSEYDDARGAAEAILAHPVARRILSLATYQKRLEWEQDGLACATRGVDIITTSGAVWDMKITTTVEPEALSLQAWRMLWHAQVAWYIDGARASGVGVNGVGGILAVEATPPHDVTALVIPPAILDMGRRSIRLWTERHRACELADHWPGHVQSETEMTLPHWVDEAAE